MTANDDPSQDIPDHLIRFCEDFQRELRVGSQPRIEDYLARWGERPQQEPLFAELLKLEVHFLHEQKQTITPEGYKTRFPEHAEAIDQLFEREKSSDNGQPSPSDGVHIRCPHCHNPIELIENQSLNDIECQSCGSSFSLLPETETVTCRAPEQETIGHFALEQRLGAGAFGTVWRAQDQQLDRKVAIKVPRKGQLSAKETEQFLREARAAAQLRHPNIVSVHEVGRQGDSVYIVSDFVEGVTLGDWLTARRPTFREAAELCAKIAEALHHAHEKGVIHRDLKPGNIMLDQDGTPHIMDFGLAKRETGEITMTMDGQILGTPAYMSPEQARGEGHRVDRRADIYSLGVILFELLTGELPFRGNTRMLIHQLLTEDVPSPRKLNSAVPRDLETICLKCLRRESSRRYDTVLQVAVDLRHWLEGKPIHARPVTRIEKSWLWCRRRPDIAGIVLGSSALMLAMSWYMIRARYEAESARLVQSLIQAESSRVPFIIESLEDYRRFAEDDLKAALADASDNSSAKLHVSLALLRDDPSQLSYLTGQLQTCSVTQLPIVRRMLLPYSDHIADKLWSIVRDDSQDNDRRFQASAALAELAPEDLRWREIQSFVSQHLTTAISPANVGDWTLAFQPARAQLAGTLTAIHSDHSIDQKQRASAAIILLEYFRDQPDRLCDILLATDEFIEFKYLLDAIRPSAKVVHQRLLKELNASLPDALNKPFEELSQEDQQLRDAFWRRQSLAAVALMELGFGGDVWPRLSFTPNPSLRSFIINNLGALSTSYHEIIERLLIESDVGIRRALVQSLGGIEATKVPASVRSKIVAQLTSLYLDDPDSGIHSSASWALRRWRVPLPVDAGGRTLESSAYTSRTDKATRRHQSEREATEMSLPSDVSSRRWYVNGQGQTMIVIPRPASTDGPKLDHSFAICSHEVTVAEFRRFQPDHDVEVPVAPHDGCPVHNVTWYEAAAYCNWLNEQEGIPEDQWVYQPNENGQYVDGMTIKENYSELIGYRLPTYWEWKYACHSGSKQRFYFGDTVSLLKGYGWYASNSDGESHVVEGLLPNEFGVFDMHGNLWEWTQNTYRSEPTSPVKDNASRFLCGGLYSDPGSFFSDDTNVVAKPDVRDYYYGFRVARSLTPDLERSDDHLQSIPSFVARESAILRAAEHGRKGDWDQQVLQLEQIATQQKRDLAIWNQICLASLQVKDSRRAVSAANTMLELAPRNLVGNWRRADAELGIQELDLEQDVEASKAEIRDQRNVAETALQFGFKVLLKEESEGLNLVSRVEQIPRSQVRIEGLVLDDKSSIRLLLFSPLIDLSERCSVKAIALAHQELSADNLASLAKLASLEKLSLLSCNVSDDALAQLSRSRSLKTLELRDSPFSAGSLRWLAMSLVESLVVGGADIEDSHLAAIGQADGLRNVQVLDSHISDGGLVHLVSLNKLRGLVLAGSPVSDSCLSHIAKMNQIEDLNLRDTKVIGAGFDAFREIPTLKYLYIDHTQVNDSAVPDLERLSWLQRLNIEGTNITEAGFKRLVTSLPDCEIIRQK